MSNFRPELHVAQQSRRDKLRFQQNSVGDENLETFNNNLEKISVHHRLNPDFMQFRNYQYDSMSYHPSAITSEMFNVAASSHSDTMVVHQDSRNQRDKAIASEEASFTGMSHAMKPTFNHPAKVRGNSYNCSTWKSIGPQGNDALVANYTCGSRNESNAVDFMPSYLSCHDVQSSMTNPSSEISSKNSPNHHGNMRFNSPSLYQNTLQDVVTSATIGNQEVKMLSFVPQNMKSCGSWTDANELVFLPSNYSVPASQKHPSCSSGLINRPLEGRHQWVGELNFPDSERDPRVVATDNSSRQGLSLSLSSPPLSYMNVDQNSERNVSEHMHSGGGGFSDIPDLKSLKSGSKSSIGGQFKVNSGKDMVGTSTFNHQNVGPLGPFTGYATILRCSKFLMPAQQLLDESCNIANPKTIMSEEIRVSSGAINADEAAFGAKMVDSGGSSSIFISANGKSREPGDLSCSNESIRPEYLQKAKLLYMQEEVCRRYKQYHHQMQMVVTSFESVAGLSSATPYVSLALKTISRNFRCLRNAISDQLRSTRKALGEDFSSPTTGTSNGRGDTSSSRLKFIDQSFQKQKAGGGRLGFLEPQQVWRPQRGLPERAVSVLRAWLFEHFLHPYPTDAVKHILATQTGLTKNQVSNWFINARVRVWKPMVEEIHTLETKGLAESGSNVTRTDNDKACTEGTRGQNVSQQLNMLGTSTIPDDQIESSNISYLERLGDRSNPDMWNHDKRLRDDHCQTPADMEGSLVSFVPYHRSGIEIEARGAVSLTLGLRQSVENAQQQQQQLQQPEHQFMQHFGGQNFHDFEG